MAGSCRISPDEVHGADGFRHEAVRRRPRRRARRGGARRLPRRRTPSAPGRTRLPRDPRRPGTAGYARPAADLDPPRRAARDGRRRCSRRWTPTRSTGGRRRSTASPPSSPLTRPRRCAAMTASPWSRRTRPCRWPGCPGAGAGLGRPQPARGGAGVVVGLVDTGIWPESSLFAEVPGLGRGPRGFRGVCVEGGGWHADDCNRKLVGARWFVDGFGEDNVRSASVALAAATTAATAPRWRRSRPATPGVSVQVPRPAARSVRRRRSPGPDRGLQGVLDARPTPPTTAAPPPTWSPRSTRATSDGVDVLNLSVGGPSTVDTVERALLGAAEQDIVVVAPPGNGGRAKYAAHPSPWVTSVGGTTGDELVGRVALPDGVRLDGAMASARSGRPGPAGAGCRGAGRPAPRRPRPGSADPAPSTPSRTEGRIVVCERGGIGRVAKSRGRPPGRRRRHGARQRAARPGRVRPARRTHRPPARGRRAARSAGGMRRHPDARVTLAPARPAHARAGGHAVVQHRRPDRAIR